MSHTEFRSGRHRVHPLTPILTSFGIVWAAILFALFNITSWWSTAVQVYSDHVLVGWLLTIAGLILLLAVLALGSWVSWRFRFFELADDEVRIGHGWIVRSRRSARFDRVQAIDINQPLLARPLGLAELKIETAGGDDSDLTIKFLKLDQAQQLQQQILAVSEATEDTEETPESHSTPLHGPINTGTLWGSEALSGLVFFLGVAIAIFVVVAIAALAIFLHGLITGEPLIDASTLVASAGGILLGVGIGIGAIVVTGVAAIVASWNTEHDFTLAADDHERRLQISAGLTSTRKQTVPFDRVHGLKEIRPLWWRPAQWSQVKMLVAGYAATAEKTTTLLPVAKYDQTNTVIDAVLHRVAEPESVSPAQWHSPRRAWWLSPIDLRQQSVRVDPRGIEITLGRFWARRIYIPWQRVQGYTVLTSPLRRLANVVDVQVDLVPGPITAIARELSPEDAQQFVAELSKYKAA